MTLLQIIIALESALASESYLEAVHRYVVILRRLVDQPLLLATQEVQ
jgi:hypothetical protein